MNKFADAVKHVRYDFLRVDHEIDRDLVGISGAPGSGKSTLSQALQNELNSMEHGQSSRNQRCTMMPVFIPMIEEKCY